jgi:CheY-like chemotaxis protein
MNGKRAPASTTSWLKAEGPVSDSAAEGPRERAVTQEIEVTGPPDQRAGQPCLLVIASQPAYADTLIARLGVGQRQIEVAHAGIEGLRLIDLIRPDIVMCDLELRGMPNAHAIARTLRSDPGFDDLYLVGLTGRELAICEEDGIRAGFDEIVPKSGDVAAIEEIIRKLCYEVG